jgi:hypothetical protein
MPIKRSIALVLLFASGVFLNAQTVALPKMMVIEPIFIQNGVGGNIAVQTNYSADFALFQAATQRVYAQAGIRVVWASSSVFVSSTFYTISGASDVGNLVAAQGKGYQSGTTTLTVWFTGSNGGILGVSNQSLNVSKNAFVQPDPVYYNGATVSESTFVAGGTYSLTTLAHEIGHVLGLDHNLVNAGPTYNTTTAVANGNLMKDGSVGGTTFSGITSDGSTGFGVLTANQISMLLLSPYVRTNSTANDTYTYSSSAIPEPADFVLIASAVAGVFVIGRRRGRTAIAAKQLGVFRNDT